MRYLKSLLPLLMFMKVLLTLALILCLGGSTTKSSQGNPYLPNLIVPARVMTEFMHISGGHPGECRYLNISFAGANVGPGHLVMVGDKDPTKEIWTARQAVCDPKGKWTLLDHKAGFFDFHGGNHGHLHWNTWALYGLINLQTGEITKSAKKSFSLRNSRETRNKLPAPGQPETVPNPLVVGGSTYPMLASRWLTKIGQRIEAGYMDVYTPWSNEAIPFSGDGLYLLVGMVDPEFRIVEWNENDNYSAVLLSIIGGTFTVLKYWEAE